MENQKSEALSLLHCLLVLFPDGKKEFEQDGLADPALLAILEDCDFVLGLF